MYLTYCIRPPRCSAAGTQCWKQNRNVKTNTKTKNLRPRPRLRLVWDRSYHKTMASNRKTDTHSHERSLDANHQQSQLPGVWCVVAGSVRHRPTVQWQARAHRSHSTSACSLHPETRHNITPSWTLYSVVCDNTGWQRRPFPLSARKQPPTNLPSLPLTSPPATLSHTQHPARSLGEHSNLPHRGPG